MALRKLIIIVLLILFSQINCFADAYGQFFEIGFNYSQVFGAGTLNEFWNRHSDNFLARPIQDDITFESQFYGAFFSMTWKYFKFNIELGGGPVIRDSSQGYFEGIESLGGNVDGYTYELHHVFEGSITLLGKYPLLHSKKYFSELAPLAGISYKIPDLRAVHFQGGLGIYIKWLYLEALYGLRVGGYYPIDHFERQTGQDTEKIARTWLSDMSLHGFTLKVGISFYNSGTYWNEHYRIGNTSYGNWYENFKLRGN